MGKKQRQTFVAAYVGIVGGGGVIWLFSWAIQFICSLLLGNRGFGFHNQAGHVLAASTVVYIATFMVAWAVVKELSANRTLMVLVPFGISTAVGIGWVTGDLFSGTPVSTAPAQILYSLVAVVTGLSLCYALFRDSTSAT